MPFWVPPAGWQAFQTNFDALSALHVPAQYQRTVDALLRSGHTFIADSEQGITVNDSDIQNWLFMVQKLATKLHNAPMQQTSQAGMDETTGVFSDAYRYWQPELATIDAAMEPYADLIEWGIIAIGLLVLLPPLLNAIGGRR